MSSLRRFEWDEYFAFPDPGTADREGVVAWGGNLSPGIILSAYRQGIFPWYSDPPPVWFSPNPRFVLFPEELHVSESLRKTLKKKPYRITFDQAFSQVIRSCSETPRPGQDGTWISQDIIDGYTEVHQLGFAHSVEAWEGDTLVGGLYGIRLGKVFYGESMFAHRPNASKVAFVTAVEYLKNQGIELIDCQAYTDYLASFGARLIPRKDFLGRLKQLVEFPGPRGPWVSQGL